MYGTLTGDVLAVTGFVQGHGTASNGSFSSSDARDFGYTPSVGASLAATYTTTPSISGTFTEGGNTISFSGAPNQGSLYDYAAAASLSAISGNWTMTALTGETIALNVSSGGAFTAAGSSGCNFSGTVAPRSSGKNVFNLSITFGPSPCALAGQAATGIAVNVPLSGGASQLQVGAIDSTRQYGTAAFGSRSPG